MNGIPKLTRDNLKDWRGESDHADVLLDYIENLHGQIEKLIQFGDVTEDEEGLFFGEFISSSTKVERNIRLAALLIVAGSGLLDKDGVLSYR